jgi:glutaredoxin
MLVFALVSVIGASPVDEARSQLKAGNLDEVLFALDGKKLEGGDKAKGAAVLGEAAVAAWQKKDAALALQFSQMALKLEPEQVQALEAGSKAAFSQQQFEIADSYADRWLKAEPKSGEAHVHRAELAIEAGEWQRALDALNGAGKLDEKQQRRADVAKMKAENELSERKSSMSELNTIERQMAIAQEKAAKEPRGYRPSAAPTMARTNQVVLYGTSWCGYCKEARAYFKRKHVDFVEKDVEKDPGAQAELIQKAVAAGVQPHGVPVIDVYGKLVLGWSESEVERALASR